VGGNVTAEATNTASSVENTFSSKGAKAHGILVSSDSEGADIDVSVSEDISATSTSVLGSGSWGISSYVYSDGDNDITVGGNVTVTSESSDTDEYGNATGVYSQANKNGENDITVKGNVTVTATGEATETTYTQKPSSGGKPESGTTEETNYDGKSTVVIGGDVSVTSTSSSIKAQASGLRVTAQGNTKAQESGEKAENTESTENDEETTRDKYVSAIGVNSTGIDSNVAVGGNVTVEADGEGTDGYAYGVDARAFNDGIAGVLVAGDVDVSMSGGYGYGVFALTENDASVNAIVDGGVNIESEDGHGFGLYAVVFDEGTINLTVGDDVSATTNGIVIDTDENASGVANITVDGDVTGETGSGLSIWNMGEETDTVANIIVNGALTGTETGIYAAPTITTENVNLTVWKVNLTEIGGENHAVVTDDDNGDLIATDETKAIEQDIHYIIKFEAPSNGTVSLEGTEKVNDYDTAQEGKNVVMKISANAGYHVAAAYNGDGQQVPLLVDGNGNYYIVVPRGGGVYLSAVIDPDAVDNGGDDDDTPAPAKATVVQLENATASEAASDTNISAEDAKTLSYYSPEQQVAIILTKLGLDDALKASGIRMKELAKKAANGITSDLSELVTEEELTIDGETAVWKVTR
jgi:hypothetical protein